MKPRRVGTLGLLGALALSSGVLSAQAVIPRAYGPLTLGMSLPRVQALNPRKTMSCYPDFMPAKDVCEVSPAIATGLWTAFVALGIDSATLARGDAIDLEFYHQRLASLLLPVPTETAESAVNMLVAQLGGWRGITIGPSGSVVVAWTDGRTGLRLVLRATLPIFGASLGGARTERIEVFDLHADSLMTAAAIAAGPSH